MPDENGTADEQPADDLRSILEAATEEAEKPETAKPDGDVTRETSARATGERARGPDGKFVAVEEGEGEKAPETPPERQQKAVEEPPTGVEPPKPAIGEPPALWKPADKEAFKALPPEAQRILLTRHNEMEADYTRKTQGIAAFQKEYGPIHEMFTPHLERMRANGFTPQSLIKAWSAVEDTLMTGDVGKKIGVIKGIMNVYRIPIESVMQAYGVQQGGGQQPAPNGRDPNRTAGEQQPQIDPALNAALSPLVQEVHNLRQWQQQEFDQRRTYAERQAQAELMSIDNEIEQFKATKGPDGALLHPHYPDVETHMARLAKSYWDNGTRPPPLKELYEEAVWATPSTREKLLTARQQTEEARKLADARTKTAAARKAGSSVTGGPSAGQTTKPTAEKSLREQLEEAAADAA